MVRHVISPLIVASALCLLVTLPRNVPSDFCSHAFVTLLNRRQCLFFGRLHDSLRLSRLHRTLCSSSRFAALLALFCFALHSATFTICVAAPALSLASSTVVLRIAYAAMFSRRVSEPMLPDDEAASSSATLRVTSSFPFEDAVTSYQSPPVLPVERSKRMTKKAKEPKKAAVKPAPTKRSVPTTKLFGSESDLDFAWVNLESSN
jgi:hypothetical protein